MIGLLKELSDFARTGDYADAALRLNQCVVRMQSRMSDIAANRHYQKYSNKINYSLETMLLMLKSNDWVAIADIIDFEFVPLWEEAFPET
jgi:hypothetical protein